VVRPSLPFSSLLFSLSPHAHPLPSPLLHTHALKAYNDVFTAALFKPIVMKVRIKEESFGENGEKKVKCAVSSFSPVDWVPENKMLLEAIGKWD
jgi:hypothetical protein